MTSPAQTEPLSDNHVDAIAREGTGYCPYTMSLAREVQEARRLRAMHWADAELYEECSKPTTHEDYSRFPEPRNEIGSVRIFTAAMHVATERCRAARAALAPPEKDASEAYILRIATAAGFTSTQADAIIAIVAALGREGR